ncbi:hypothetical protein G7Z17_g2491 [Cylindrodendrum hubeiense]|uniref:Calcineurin-like phosphoesterase domain-containing protein n=1 Tax=Cylindrodendrum hubeiense TaxID=595255 RepID=A0A9P5HGE4_9HYPO|nr:hypothetical protein G7Z17_g2491 [Cylindrodendrum hubeiense]
MPTDTTGRPFVGFVPQKSVAERLTTRLSYATRELEDAGAAVAASRPVVSNPACISDTRTTPSPSLYPRRILLLTGDLSQDDTFDEIQPQLTWLAVQPHPRKVVTAGNHDLLLDSAFPAAHPDRELQRQAPQPPPPPRRLGFGLCTLPGPRSREPPSGTLVDAAAVDLNMAVE